MKLRSAIVFIAAAMVLVSSCVKDHTITKNFATKRYFDSWVKTNYPGAGMTDLGAYILADSPGSGALVGTPDDNSFVFISYKSMNLDGSITGYTDSTTAKQMHEFDRTAYYGPEVSYRGSSAMKAGLEDVIKDMRVGGKRKAAIPGWLMVTDRYATAQEYLDNCTGTDAVYELEVTGVTSDIAQFQVDSIERYISHKLHKVDSLAFGFYYIQTCPPSDTATFKQGDVVHINYTGSLLSGLVFDTSIKDTAKVHGLDLTRSYGATSVTIGEDYTKYALNGGSEGNMITGFAYCLSLMKAGEKGIAVFTSDWGYQNSATTSIPAYSPLRFEIEMIGK